MTRHAELSPSKFVQWDLCPCFESGPVGDAAIQGTLEHEVLEAMLRGEEPPEHDEETAEKVVWAYEYILEEANRLGVGAGELLIEEEIHITDENMDELTFGTLDVAFQDVIYDYKSGQKRDYSAQMACYALGYMQAKGLSKVVCVELYGRYKEAVRYAVSIEDAAATVFEIAGRVKDENKKPEKNKYCGWCLKKANCKAITDNVKAVGKAVQKELTPAKLTALVKKPLGDLKPAELETLMPFVEVVESWTKAVKDHCLDRLVAGDQIDGYKIKERKGNQYITDMPEALKLSGIEQKYLDPFIKYSMTDMGKALAVQNGITQKAAKELLETQLASVLERKKSTISLGNA